MLWPSGLYRLSAPCALTGRSIRTRSGIAPCDVLVSVRRAAQCRCAPVNSDVRALMTQHSIVISLYQPDDGDGLARYKVEAGNGVFACSALIWAYAENFADLATEIGGFPTSPSSAINFQLGSPRAGQCELSFSCVDGHAVVWVSVESEHPFFPSSKYQTASLCLRIEPSAVDAFHSDLVALASGSITRAELHGS